MSILMIIVVILFHLGFVRNTQTLLFRNSLVDKYLKEPNFWEKVKIYDSLSYYEMVFKFWKGFRIESWFTEEEIKILKS